MADHERLARALGWLSLGLGLPPIAAPRAFAQAIGVSGDADSRALARLVGLRELVCAVGILRRRRPAGWLWARVAGDAMDLALLSGALNARGTQRSRLSAALAAVAGITALDLRCAVQLSRRRGEAGRGQQDRAIAVQRSVTVNRPPAEVYQFWHDFANLPRFMRHLESVQVTGDRRSHWTARAPANMTVEWDAEIIDDRPNTLIAWRSLPGAQVDNSGTVRFQPAPGERGTEVHVELRYTPPAGRLGSVVAKLFGEEPAQQVQDDLRAFKQVMETGEVVHSDASVHRRPHPAQPPIERARGA